MNAYLDLRFSNACYGRFYGSGFYVTFTDVSNLGFQCPMVAATYGFSILWLFITFYVWLAFFDESILKKCRFLISVAYICKLDCLCNS